jgi:uncharacterized Zn finger protein
MEHTQQAQCPRCASEEVVIGYLLDSQGQPIQFALLYRAEGGAGQSPNVLALYCNSCGEITLTLE